MDTYELIRRAEQEVDDRNPAARKTVEQARLRLLKHGDAEGLARLLVLAARLDEPGDLPYAIEQNLAFLARRAQPHPAPGRGGVGDGDRGALYHAASAGAVVLALLATYYAAPVALAVISLGEICAYSPAGTNLCGSGSPDTSAVPLLRTPALSDSSVPLPGRPVSTGASGGSRCKRAGIRYRETTSEGAEVCFTLSPDGGSLLEIRYTVVPAAGCGNTTLTGDVEGAQRVGNDGRIEVPGILAGTIHGASASGVLAMPPGVCGGATFRWTAHRRS